MISAEFKQMQHHFIETVIQRYAWPGGYPMFAVTKKGEALCPDCVENERDLIMDSQYDPQWQLISVEINWEEAGLTCDNCGKLIPSAYGEDPETEEPTPEPESEPTFPWQEQS